MRILQLLPIVVVAGTSVYFGLAQDATSFKTLYSFNGQPDGSNPQAGVVIGKNGALYGTTYSGGTAGKGTVFELKPPASPGGDWTETVLHEFTGHPDGANPAAGVMIGSGGVLFGTTYNGGTSALGTAFELKPSAPPERVWSETVLHNFKGPSADCCVGDGANPVAGVVIGSGGVLYGTTENGGKTPEPGESVFGTVFELKPPTSPGGAWREIVLYSFCCSGVPYGQPLSGVVIGSGGVLYGTTSGGGCHFSGCGSVFQLAQGTETVLGSFTLSTGNPVACVVIGSGGVLYGTTTNGSGSGGTAFSLTPPTSPGGAWTETVLWSFTGQPDGANPSAPVVIGSGGVLYGTTSSGGTSNHGTVFSLTPPASPGGAWTETVLYSFTGGNDGANPVAGLAMGKNGVLYGTTSSGGASNAGTVFALKP